MGELLGIPEWLAILVWVVAGLTAWIGVGMYLGSRAHRRLAAKRPNPTRDEFLHWMRADVSDVTAAWMWDNLQLYYKPLTPHPDNHLIDDASIDDDDIAMDWPRDYARHIWQRDADFLQWPEHWPLTVRYFARWLETGIPRRT